MSKKEENNRVYVEEIAENIENIPESDYNCPQLI